MNCVIEGCNEWANNWYIETGSRLGMCFGHAVHAVRTRGNYGRRERKAG